MFFVVTRYVHYGSGPKRFPIQDVLDCALEFAQHGTVATQQPSASSVSTDSFSVAGVTAGATAGIMDVDVESPADSLSRLERGTGQ